MYGIYVRNYKDTKYADLIVKGLKTIETRNRNTLGKLNGQTVAIVRTGEKRPEIIGFVDMAGVWHCDAADFHKYDLRHFVSMGSRHNTTDKGKWMYELANAKELIRPIPLPKNTIRHGRSYCEFNTEELKGE